MSLDLLLEKKRCRKEYDQGGEGAGWVKCKSEDPSSGPPSPFQCQCGVSADLELQPQKAEAGHSQDKLASQTHHIASGFS